MNILVVMSKFPPEYSGPGVRISNLYKDIYPNQTIDVLCNGIEYTDNENYKYENFNVHRRTANFLRSNAIVNRLLPSRIKGFLTYFGE